MSPMNVAAALGMRRVSARIQKLSELEARRIDVRKRGYSGPLTRQELAKRMERK